MNWNTIRIAGIALALLMSGCADSDDDATTTTPTATNPADNSSKNIAELAVGTTDLSTLVTALQAASLVDTLKGDGPFTVFAPTNAAFDKIPKADLDALLKDTAKLKAVLLHHVVPGKVMAADAKTGEVKTAGGTMLAIEVKDGKVMLGSSVVTSADIEASNGVVHLVDTVIMPPAEPAKPKNLAELAIATPELSTLLKAVQAAGLVDTLKSAGPFTVFAPTNDAFAKIPEKDLAALLKDKAKLTAVLTYHVVSGKVTSKDVKAGKVKTVQGQEITIATDNGVMVNNAKVIKADIDASNGVVHLIDTVIFPKAAPAEKKDIVDLAIASPDLSTLVTAVKAAGLVDVLKGKGPFTVFAPTNAAFAKIPKADLDALLADKAKLKNVLLYHVVAGKVMANDVKDGEVETAAGAKFKARVDAGKVYIDSATVIKTNIEASNGIIHLIDTVIIPKAEPVKKPDLVDLAVSSEKLSTLVTAVKAAGLVETLKGKGPFTVFAPTNAAFAKIPKADLDALLKDKAKLKSVLLYHVVPGKVMAKDVKAGKVKTAGGAELTISLGGGAVMVDNAKVIATDLDASNGVVHLIDTVVMPK